MTPNDHTCSRRDGSALVVAVMMLAIAGFSIGSIVMSTMTYSRNANGMYSHDKASLLADAGLRVALVRLNAGASGSIGYDESRRYFTETNGLNVAGWGFSTQLSVTNGTNLLIATGRYNSYSVDVQAEVSPGEESRTVHSLFAHAIFAGNSDGDASYALRIGGRGFDADFVNGDTYSGADIELTGDAKLRLPEALSGDVDGDGVLDPSTASWDSSYAVGVFDDAMSQAAFDAYKASQLANMDKVYGNGEYDEGEAYVDTIGNGVYDEGEAFTDSDENGVRHPGDEFTDINGNGIRDASEPFLDLGDGKYSEGEEWTDDISIAARQNGRYDGPDGYWVINRNRRGKVTSTRWEEVPGLLGEKFEDSGDGVYYAGEPYVDVNGIYDAGEAYLDDRNAEYDYGTQAPGNISGMPAPGPGQTAAVGGDASITSPDLSHMYYGVDRNDATPSGALANWGNDVAVTADDYSSNGHVLNDASAPEHIFVRNVPQSSPGSGNDQYREAHGGVQVRSRGYEIVYDNNGNRVDDYFLEDPTDSTYNTISSSTGAIAENDGNRTHPMLINVKEEDNEKVYYVQGNVYLHATPTYALSFREPGTRITIVASGNITVSDEFYYNANYDPNLQYADMDSSVVNEPQDGLCLIALKNGDCNDSGNIYIGDKAMGTGGSIHSMMYAENNFIDNNINTADQQFIGIFGNMTAGNQVLLNRDESGEHHRTRLDVTFDSRIRDGDITLPGLPPPLGNERMIGVDTPWEMIPRTWSSWSRL